MEHHHFQLQTQSAKEWKKEFSEYKQKLIQLAHSDPVAFALLVEPERPKEITLIDSIWEMEQERVELVRQGRSPGVGTEKFNQDFIHLTQHIQSLADQLENLISTEKVP